MLPTISPSIRKSSTTEAIASSPASSRSGDTLSRIGRRPAGTGQPLPLGQQGIEQRAQPLLLLQGAQPRRVRGGDVDGDVVHQRIDSAEAGLVVGDRIGGVPVHPDIGANDAKPGPQPLQPCRHGVEAGIVEAHAIDQRLVGREPEQPGSRIADLWPGRDGTDLDGGKPLAQQGERCFRVLVEARRQPQRMGQLEAGQRRSQPWVGGQSCGRKERQQPDRRPVRPLRRQQPEQPGAERPSAQNVGRQPPSAMKPGFLNPGLA